MEQKASFTAALCSGSVWPLDRLPARAIAIRVQASLGQPQNTSPISYKTSSESSLLSLASLLIFPGCSNFLLDFFTFVGVQ